MKPRPTIEREYRHLTKLARELDDGTAAGQELSGQAYASALALVWVLCAPNETDWRPSGVFSKAKGKVK